MDADGMLPAPAGFPVCRGCGCWEYGACWDDDVGACWWVEADLCSHCAAGGVGEPAEAASPARPHSHFHIFAFATLRIFAISQPGEVIHE